MEKSATRATSRFVLSEFTIFIPADSFLELLVGFRVRTGEIACRAFFWNAYMELCKVYYPGLVLMFTHVRPRPRPF